MKRLLAAGLFAFAANALASGDYGPTYWMFKAYRSPDIALDRFQAGELGVIQPGMRRVYLYTAWRGITLGPDVRGNPGTPNGLARADGSVFGQGWSYWEEPAEGGALREAVAAALKRQADDPVVRQVLACPTAAIVHAGHTLRTLAARADATRERIDAWARAQHQVGQACAQAEDRRYLFVGELRSEPQPPQPLAAAEPLVWQQMREYQRAAWHFHREQYADSTPLFERIGATDGHPMQGLGKYLALRSEVRRAVAVVATSGPAEREQQARALERRGQAIIADKTLEPMHEPTRGLLRSMRASLTPETQLAALNGYLDRPEADPYALDRLGDWSILMDRARPAELRARHEFIDWIETLRDCDAQATANGCTAAFEHAHERWQQTHARAWLVAAMMLAESMSPALEKAALDIAPGHPAYLTVRYHLARLYRLAGNADATRTVTEAALRQPLSPATRNLFREERFAVATSVRDAAPYMLRTNVDYARAGGKHEDMLNTDVRNWFRRLSSADMVALAQVDTLPRELRARIAGAAWLRAALLDKKETGAQAASLLATLVPGLADAAQRYQRAGSPQERRHVALLAAMSFGVSAELEFWGRNVERMPQDEVTASAWCRFSPDYNEERAERFPWLLPAAPQLGDVVAAREELARLAPLKTATGVVGEHVMAWARSHPDDPDLPWLLHVVVRSTRGGCLDPDAPVLSRKAFALLHKRFPGNAWTRKTPYFYGTLSQ